MPHISAYVKQQTLMQWMQTLSEVTNQWCIKKGYYLPYYTTNPMLHEYPNLTFKAYKSLTRLAISHFYCSYAQRPEITLHNQSETRDHSKQPIGDRDHSKQPISGETPVWTGISIYKLQQIFSHCNNKLYKL